MATFKLDVLRALKGFRMAAGASDASATAWASANLKTGTALVQKAHDATTKQDPMAGRHAAFEALKKLAAAK